MNRYATVLAMAATVSLVSGLVLSHAISPAFASAVAGLAWIGLLIWRPRLPVHGLFLCMTLGVAGFIAVRGYVVLALVGATGALFAWDAASVRQLLVALPATAVRRIVPRYVTHSAATAAITLVVPLVATVARPVFSFPAAFGILLGILCLLGVALWQSGRLAPRSDVAEADAAKPPLTNEKGGQPPFPADRPPDPHES